MMAGKGPVPLVGLLMVTEKETDLPPSEAVMDRVLPEKVADTEDGLGGRVPSSYFWNSWLISALRHSHRFLLVTLDPEVKVKGSGRVDTEAPKPPADAGHVMNPPVEVVVLVTGGTTTDVVGVVGVVAGPVVDVLDVVLLLVGAAELVPGIHW